MAQIIPIGEPANDGERRAIRWLRDHGPDEWVVLHNFEIGRRGRWFEIDLAVLTPHLVYLVDVKGTVGTIEVAQSRWYPESREPFFSPVRKLRDHSREFKGMLVDGSPRADLRRLFVEAAVLLVGRDARLVDPEDRDAPFVTTLEECVAFLGDRDRVPSGFSSEVAPLLRHVQAFIEGRARPRRGPLRFGHWVIVEKLGSTDQISQYRARNEFAAAPAGTALLRIYEADPYLPDSERLAQRQRIANAYTALSRLPTHPNIVSALDFFPTEGDEQFVLVTEDVPGRALRLHLSRPQLPLTLDQKLRVVRGLLAALAHAHAHEVVHRAVSPSSVLVGRGGYVYLTGFEFARAGGERQYTVAGELLEQVDAAYQAPECHGNPGAASTASDVFSAGLLLYELFAGERPFVDTTELHQRQARFPTPRNAAASSLPAGLVDWLQRLCSFEPSSRPSAADALRELSTLTRTSRKAVPTPTIPSAKAAPDYRDLPKGYPLTRKYQVVQRLGSGGFGVVYKVFDTLADTERALKVIIHDRQSPVARLLQEYRTLLHLPPHDHVVRVHDADFLPDDTPYLVFEFVEGLDVGALIDSGEFTPADGLRLGKEVAAGLAHLHANGVYHCDVKPKNLLWTEQGAKIIDFNVSVTARRLAHGGGSDKYLPPDLDTSVQPDPATVADRDVYALGITLYEAVTGGRYPWASPAPTPGMPPTDPRDLTGFRDLTSTLVDAMLKAIAPRRADRYPSAGAFLDDLRRIREVRVIRPAVTVPSVASLPVLTGTRPPPNVNPFVNHLATLYSQSRHSNRGTRGIDPPDHPLYAETQLDRELLPTVLAGQFRLVIITGNAGDGKTAWLQHLAEQALKNGAIPGAPLPNGDRFTLAGQAFLSNHDGSQDEGGRVNDAVLDEFFVPFAGADAADWPTAGTRLIAINEGRLVDFLEGRPERFGLLATVVRNGLATGVPERGIAVVNLNLRSVVADVVGEGNSIFEQLLRKMTDEGRWADCLRCDLRDRCYAHHNARTLGDPVAGPRVVERLKTLYTLTHLRDRLHITLRDLRSALAFTLTGGRDCDELHELYRSGDTAGIADGLYFNSWMGGPEPTHDRLLSLLAEIDIGAVDDPRLGRHLDFAGPDPGAALLTFEQRGGYDSQLLAHLFEKLPRGWTGTAGQDQVSAHRPYVAMAQRRFFFECRDEQRWQELLPYRSAARLQALISNPAAAHLARDEILSAINRGEGITGSIRLAGSLALQTRSVQGGTVRSYRLFPRDRFGLAPLDTAASAKFVERTPTGLVLRYHGPEGVAAELRIALDVFEMLYRLNQGYRPTLEEQQGYYLDLMVFKHVLAAVPYHEVLLTTSGHEFHRIERTDDGRLRLHRLVRQPDEEEVADAAPNR